MAEKRFLVLRMSALGDIIHTLPAVHSLREAFPSAQIDWLVDEKWAPILAGNPDISNIIAMNRGSWRKVMSAVGWLRRARYDVAIDFQSLYRSAIMGWLSGARERIGFDAQYSRERGAARFYTRHVQPKRAHKIEHNLELVESLGARTANIAFPLADDAQAAAEVKRILCESGAHEYFVLSPGGGWVSKCWPAERYGELARTLAERYGWTSIVSFGPGEEGLAETVRRSAGSPEPLVQRFSLKQLVPLLRGAKFAVAGDTGPLHLASALGTAVIGLYGPTDPSRNGPYSAGGVVVRKTGYETTYKRGKAFSEAMLAISVDDVLATIERRMACGR
ncbi:MAG TPA: glycosyltransferase family 9 protein [Candidatus Acidoferrales bacterium]|nr:glycosyltransferase family 9 protein [Candidatus Acidoferrales bacterium]